MTIPAATVAAFAPWGNATLEFQLATHVVTDDPETGNYLPGYSVVEYLAALTISQPNWTPQPGVDQATYNCRGRLLSPSTLDPRITNGSQATAVINGIQGRFELVFDLAQDPFHYPTLRQLIAGTFRLRGGP